MANYENSESLWKQKVIKYKMNDSLLCRWSCGRLSDGTHLVVGSPVRVHPVEGLGDWVHDHFQVLKDVTIACY